MTYEEFQSYFIELDDELEKNYGTNSNFFRNKLQNLKNDYADDYSYEMLYSIALHSSLQTQINMKFMSIAKVFLESENPESSEDA